MKPEEDLAGISTDGARENSKVLKHSLVDAHHKVFDYKDPKKGAQHNFERSGKTQRTNESSLIFSSFAAQTPHLKNLAWTAVDASLVQ